MPNYCGRALVSLVAAKRARRAQSGVDHPPALIDAIAPVLAAGGSERAGLANHGRASGGSGCVGQVAHLYAAGTKSLPGEVTAARLGPAWRQTSLTSTVSGRSGH